MPQERTVVLENRYLLSLAASDRYVKAFPFLGRLRSASAASGGCGKCGRQQPELAGALTAARTAIINLGAEDRRRFKALIGADRVKIASSVGGRQVTLSL
jgi:hypothetical protein